VHATNLTQLPADEAFRRNRAIDEIVFQTNLLALHAAVEAADGGDSGSAIATASNELAGLLRGCQQDVERGCVEYAPVARSVKNGRRG